MSVDSFKFLPRIIAFYYQRTSRVPEFPIPWTPLTKPLNECLFGLITSGGIYHKTDHPPFDVEREKREPTWGDPSFRKLSSDVHQDDIAVSHLHINTKDILKDINILLPVNRFQTLAEEGLIGGIASSVYTFMGFQGFPPDTMEWEKDYGPRVADELLEEGVDCVFLTPA